MFDEIRVVRMHDRRQARADRLQIYVPHDEATFVLQFAGIGAGRETQRMLQVHRNRPSCKPEGVWIPRRTTGWRVMRSPPERDSPWRRASTTDLDRGLRDRSSAKRTDATRDSRGNV